MGSHFHVKTKYLRDAGEEIESQSRILKSFGEELYDMAWRFKRNDGKDELAYSLLRIRDDIQLENSGLSRVSEALEEVSRLYERAENLAIQNRASAKKKTIKM